tara:strand:- start:48 stop:257 length:210 start_codon:yes stop_codon:yes gene_type:complete
MNWLQIYSDKTVEIWEDRIIHARFSLNLNHDERKKFLIKKHGITEDEYNGICDLIDEKEINKTINDEEV